MTRIASIFQSRRRPGSALLLVLWCVAIVSVAVLGVARMVGADVDDASVQNKRFEARELALTGIALGMHPKIEPWDPLLDQHMDGGRELRVRVISEASRLDINRALKEKDQKTLRELFHIWGAKDEEISTAVDSLLDWTDNDDLRSLNGAERSDLKKQTLYSLPANRDFRSVGEMERVRGMDVIAGLKPDWDEFFTVNGGRRIDLQEASIDLLRAGGFSQDQARMLDELRRGPDKEMQTKDDFKIKNMTEVLHRIGVTEFQLQELQSRFGAGLGPMRINSHARIGGTDYRIVAVAARGAQDNGLIVWDEQ